jgi:hypothetical protein
MPGGVSIPFWVFSLPRQLRTDTCSLSGTRFNPVLGFLPASTSGRLRGGVVPAVSIPFWVFSLPRHTRRPIQDSRLSFNPVLGFLPASTTSPIQGAAERTPCFNPVLGFLPASTRPYASYVSTMYRVSIPFWVFSLPRPVESRK